MTRLTRNIFWFCMGLVLTLATFSALATTPTKPPEPTSQTQSQTTAQTQSSSQTQYTSSNSAASNASYSGGQESSYASDDESLAIGFANPTTAAPVFTRCHESRGGKHVIAGSWGARVTIDADCQAFEQCMTIAKTYIELGANDLAIAQLAQCGGQPEPAEAVCESVDDAVDQALEVCLQK